MILEAYLDVRRQRRGKKIKHVASSWFRGLAWAVSSLAIHWNVPGMAVLLSLIFGFQFWLMFNIVHNSFTNRAWYYGNNGLFDSILAGRDNRFKNIGLKLGLLIASAFTYFNILSNGIF